MATAGAPASVVDQVLSPTSSSTYNLSPYASDLVLSIPTFIANAASYASERIDYILYGRGSMIAEATGSDSRNVISAAATQARSTSSVPNLGETSAGSSSGGKMLNLLAFEARSLDGIFRYVTSKW